MAVTVSYWPRAWWRDPWSAAWALPAARQAVRARIEQEVVSPAVKDDFENNVFLSCIFDTLIRLRWVTVDLSPLKNLDTGERGHGLRFRLAIAQRLDAPTVPDL